MCRVNLVTFSETKNEKEAKIQTETIQYELKGVSAENFEPSENDSVTNKIDAGGSYLVIESKINNKFNFYQKILSYGTDCKIIAPVSAKQEFLGILKKIKAGYFNE